MKIAEFPRDVRVTLLSDVGAVTPSFFIRFRDPIELLTSNWNFGYSFDSELVRRMLPNAGILIVQRSMDYESVGHMECAKQLSIPVIYETDDFLLDLPRESGFKVTDDQKANIRKMLRLADLVTCSTAALARRLGEYNERLAIIENYAIPFPRSRMRSGQDPPHLAIVNTDYFKLIKSKGELFEAVRKAILTLGYRVSFFGSMDPLMQELASSFPGQVALESSFIPCRRAFLDNLLTHGINVALVPLEVTESHRFKSDIKYLDFASIGVPGIFNNTEIYGRVCHERTGYICDGGYRGWLDGLAFFADTKNRIRCAEAVHQDSHSRTIENYAEEFADLLLNSSRSNQIDLSGTGTHHFDSGTAGAEARAATAVS